MQMKQMRWAAEDRRKAVAELERKNGGEDRDTQDWMVFC